MCSFFVFFFWFCFAVLSSAGTVHSQAKAFTTGTTIAAASKMEARDITQAAGGWIKTTEGRKVRRMEIGGQRFYEIEGLRRPLPSVTTILSILHKRGMSF
jgi:hypothetical protein